jgi:hypothetical protein
MAKYFHGITFEGLTSRKDRLWSLGFVRVETLCRLGLVRDEIALKAT